MSDFSIEILVADGVGILSWGPTASLDALSEAVGLTSAELLARPELRRVEVVIDTDDRVGRRALHRAGFRLEGIRRAALVADDGYADAAVYARLADDSVGGPHGFSGVMNSVLPRKRCIAHALVRDVAGRVCVLETTFKSDWELPGGIVETNESPRQGCEREITEELGLELSVGRLLVVDWLGPYLGWEDALELIFDAGVLSREQVAAVVPDAFEVRGVHWLDLAEALPYLAPFARGRLGAAVAALSGETVYLERGRPV